MKTKIDFVIPQVNGNDPKWREERKKYSLGIKVNEKHYRDWDNLQYWFRGGEKFALFVNKIHFITEGHLPNWLNLKHPKLNIVKHSDYMPKEYLPVFSPNLIELNLHRIKDLEEYFVYFNDDTFLTNYINEDYFFINGKAVNNIEESFIMSKYPYDTFPHILLNDISIINKNFSKKAFKGRIRKNQIEYFTGFYNNHLANPFKKSIIKQIWKKEEKNLDKASYNKFRTVYDLS